MISNPKIISERTMKACISAVKAILPSTFPYLVLSSILVSSGCCEFLGNAFSPFARLFSLSPSCFSVIIVSLICGFPIGGAMTSNLYERGLCTKEEGGRLIAFCNFCGPPYIFGVFGRIVMGSATAGLTAYLTQAVCTLLLGIIIGNIGNKKREEQTGENRVRIWAEAKENIKTSPRLSHIFCSAICKAGTSCVNIFCYVIFFSILCGILNKFIPIESEMLKAVFFGIIEISNGMDALKGCQGGVLTYFTGCLIIYFSSFSVHLQVISTLHPDISPKKYLISRIIFAPVCAALSTLIYLFILKFRLC